MTMTTAVDPADHLKFVGHVINKCRFSREIRDDGDLKQAGMIGLVLASKSYDPAKGTSFLDYAKWCIKSQLWAHHAEGGAPVKIPRAATEAYIKAKRDGTEGMSATKRRWAEAVEATRGREAMRLGVDKMEDSGLLAENDDVRRVDDADELAILMRRAGLTAKEHAALLAYYGADGSPPRTFEEVAEETGCTWQNIRHLVRNALAKLRMAAGVGEGARS